MATTLPAGWTLATLGELCGPGQYGWSCRASPAGSVRCLRTSDISGPGPGLDWPAVPFCSALPARLSRYLLAPGDIVVSRSGSIGCSRLLREVPQPTVFGSYLVRLRPSAAVEPRYLAAWLQAPRCRAALAAAASGMGRPNLNAAALAALRLPVAPPAQQRRIADKLDAVRARVQACRAHLARVAPLLQRFRRSVLEAAVSGRLTRDWRRRAGLGLETVAFEQLLAPRREGLRRGPFGSDLRKSGFVAAGYKVYGQRHAIQDDATLDGPCIGEPQYRALQDFAVRPGDFIVSCAGTIGRMTRLPPDAAPGLINQALLRIRIDVRQVDPRYFRLLFDAPGFQAALLGRARGSPVPNMAAVRHIRQIEVALPALEEQAEIVRRVERLFGWADRLEARLRQAEAAVAGLEPALLDQAFRGGLVGPDAADVLAAAQAQAPGGSEA